MVIFLGRMVLIYWVGLDFQKNVMCMGGVFC